MSDIPYWLMYILHMTIPADRWRGFWYWHRSPCCKSHWYVGNARVGACPKHESMWWHGMWADGNPPQLSGSIHV
jgi:hypothetical protein